MVKLSFQQPLFIGVASSFRNHSNMLIWCLCNISYYCVEQRCLIFVWKSGCI